MLGKMGIHEAIASFMTRAAQRKGKYGLRTWDSVTADYRVYTVVLCGMRAGTHFYVIEIS